MDFSASDNQNSPSLTTGSRLRARLHHRLHQLIPFLPITAFRLLLQHQLDMGDTLEVYSTSSAALGASENAAPPLRVVSTMGRGVARAATSAV
jgi:hypothetical protein